MGHGYSRSPKLLKGALVEFSHRFLWPIPNVIMFQYNPDALTRSLDVYTPPSRDDGSGAGSAKAAAGNVQPFDPTESFSLTLELDATDALEQNDPIALVSGVADRIAALEMLLYPLEEGLLSGLKKAPINTFGFGGLVGKNVSTSSKRGTVPLVLLIWGPGRIVPVRLTSFQVEEQAFSTVLYPTRAKVTVGLKILTRADLATYKDTIAKKIATTALGVTRKQKQVWAATNTANNVESILSLLT